MKYLTSLLCTLLMSSCSGTVSNTFLPTNESLQPTGELIFKEDEELQEKLATFEPEAKGKLGVFAVLIEDARSVSFNGNERFAMQSVVKVPVAMLVIQQVAEGKFTLDQKIKFTTEDLANPNQRSPLRDKNSKGGEATIDELIRLAIVESDGTACDVLTRIAGGAAAVQSYVASLGISGMEMKRTHKEFGKDWDLQYENWTTPEAAVELVEGLYRGEGGMQDMAEVLLNYMTESIPGQNRIKGLLPLGTSVAHKTGTGGTRNGITSATNDIGIITLPNGKHVALAVFVGDSTADEKARELVIAKVAKAVFDTWSD